MMNVPTIKKWTSPAADAMALSGLELEKMLESMPGIGASDLLLSPGTLPQYRINGKLTAIGNRVLTPKDTEQLACSLLDAAQIEDLRKNRSIDTSKGFQGIARFRVNVFFQRGSIAAAIRRIPYEIPSFKELGLPPIVKDFASAPHGLVLITGPAGSGKSTTLAAMIDYINSNRHVHIVCIEDPIEFVHKHRKSVIDQREIYQDASSFAEALKSVFRQSPDIIMVGEMRDLETIRLALTLAETGHLILGTLHTHDTSNAISRITSSFPTHEQQHATTVLASILVGIVSQILIPTRDGQHLVLAYEVMKANDAIRNLIREHQTQQMYSTIQTGRNDGMISMNESLSMLCDRDLISRESAMQRSPRPKELASMLDVTAIRPDKR